MLAPEMMTKYSGSVRDAKKVDCVSFISIGDLHQVV